MEKSNLLIIEKEGSCEKQEFEIVGKNSENELKSLIEPVEVPESEEKKECVREEKRTKCEVYSRVVGYFRPVTQWNEGKQAEWKDRKMFKISPIVEIKQSI